MKETSLSFCSFDLTWLLMVRLAKGTTATQPAFNFYQNEDCNLCLCCCRCSACLFCCRSGWCQSIVCIACPASVARVMRGASVTWLYFLLFLCKFFITCFIVVLSVVVAGDLRHEYAQSAWGFLFRGNRDCCICPTCIAAIDAPLTMIVIAGWVLLWYSQRSHDAFVTFVWQGRLVASPRLSLSH